MKNIILLISAILSNVLCQSNYTAPTYPNNTDTPELKEVSVASTNNEEQNAWIIAKIDSTMQAHNIPALSIGIVRNGKLDFVKGFGTMDRDSDIAVDGNSIYQIGSDTKKFTGIIANNLAKEGVVDLDVSIATYLSDKLSPKAKKRVEHVTLRNLLHHKSGVPYRIISNSRIDGDPMLNPYTEELLLKDLNSMKLVRKPNEKFGYSNFGYAIVGYICEQASNQPYHQLVKKYITEPYHLSSTFVYPNAQQKQRIVTPYRKNDRTIKSQPWNMGKATSGGGIYSTVTDQTTLIIEFINAYKDFHKTKNANHPLIITDNGGTNETHYGFGLSKSVNEKGIHYGHGGDLDGFASVTMFSPDLNIGLSLLTSSGGKWFGELEGEIYKYLRLEAATSVK